jgi:ClpP class serine protease
MNASAVSLIIARGEHAELPSRFAARLLRFASWDGTVKAAAPVDPNKPEVPAVDWNGDPLARSYRVGDVQVIEISGALTLRPSFVERNLDGMLGYDKIGEWISAAISNGAKGILLVVDSPGGSITGWVELGNIIADAAKIIPVAVFVDSCNASAAYGVSCPAGFIGCTQTAVLGSIGVKATILDASEFLKSLGLVFRSFASGKFKVAGDPTQPMTDAHAEMFQGLVTSSADDFKSFVSTYRPKISEDSMQGQIFHGKQAVQAGFADAIVSGMGQMIDMLNAGQVPLQGRGGRSAHAGGFRAQSAERNFESEWKASTELQREFSSATMYAVYAAAVAAGRVRVSERPKRNSYSVADWKNGKLKD